MPPMKPSLILMVVALLWIPSGSMRAQEPPPKVPEAATPQPEDPLHFGEPVPPDSVGVINGAKVTVAEFCAEMAAEHTRPAAKGRQVVDSLIDEAVISREMTKRNLSVEEGEVDEQIAAMDTLQREQPGGKPLVEILRESGVPMAIFRKKMRWLVALDKLVRGDTNLPGDKPVSNLHRTTWLADHRKRATIKILPDAVPSGAVATVDDEVIPATAFTRDVMVTLEPVEISKTVQNLLQEKLMAQILAGRNKSIGDSDLLAEWEHRKARFEQNPRFKGIPYEDIIKQQTGLDGHSVRSSLGFRVNAGIGIIAREWFTEAQLQEGYEAHIDRYGPRVTLSQILIECSEHELRQKQGVPNFEQGKARAAYALQEIEKGGRFDDLARTFSNDRATRMTGGRLPPFTPGLCVYEVPILDQAMKMEVGDISPPVKTRSGWHILKLDKLEPPVPLSDPEVQDDLRRFLAQQLLTEAYRAARIGIHVQTARIGLQ
jgi:hypothetical protein